MEILLFWLSGRVAGPEAGPGRKWQGLGPALSIASAATVHTHPSTRTGICIILLTSGDERIVASADVVTCKAAAEVYTIIKIILIVVYTSAAASSSLVTASRRITASRR